MKFRQTQALAVAALSMAGILWGAGFPFGKIALSELGFAQLVFYRFFLATLLLLPLAIHTRIFPKKRDIPLFILTGFLTVPLTFLLQFAGLAYTTSANAALLMGAAPPVLALAAFWFCHERMHLLDWLAIAASTLGVVLIVGKADASGWLGDIMILGSVFIVAAAILLSKRLMNSYPSTIATAYIFAFGTIFCLPAAWLWEGPLKTNLSLTVWGSILVLGAGCSALAYIFYNWGLARMDASRAAVYLNLEPLVGAILGVAMLHEPLGAGALAGGLLILGAAAYISWPRRIECPSETEALPSHIQA